MGWEELKTESATQLDHLQERLRAPRVNYRPTAAVASEYEELAVSHLRCDSYTAEEGDKRDGGG